MFGQLGLATECARLDGGEVHATELQELTVRVETTKIAGLSQNGWGIDRADPWDRCQQLIIR